ncbi:hypothetical protein SRO_0514 [Streptomyces rochei]|nr:hypothetical protein SRO_0514 [Streptomyces rochei]
MIAAASAGPAVRRRTGSASPVVSVRWGVDIRALSFVGTRDRLAGGTRGRLAGGGPGRVVAGVPGQMV